jgi:hypothetical protein
VRASTLSGFTYVVGAILSPSPSVAACRDGGQRRIKFTLSRAARGRFREITIGRLTAGRPAAGQLLDGPRLPPRHVPYPNTAHLHEIHSLWS